MQKQIENTGDSKESIKMHVLYDCLAKSSNQTPSFDHCLETRPPPQA